MGLAVQEGIRSVEQRLRGVRGEILLIGISGIGVMRYLTYELISRGMPIKWPYRTCTGGMMYSDDRWYAVRVW